MNENLPIGAMRILTRKYGSIILDIGGCPLCKSGKDCPNKGVNKVGPNWCANGRETYKEYPFVSREGFSRAVKESEEDSFTVKASGREAIVTIVNYTATLVTGDRNIFDGESDPPEIVKLIDGRLHYERDDEPVIVEKSK